jgi:hypothetical protein
MELLLNQGLLVLGDFLNKKNIMLTTDFSIGRVDNENKKL